MAMLTTVSKPEPVPIYEVVWTGAVATPTRGLLPPTARDLAFALRAAPPLKGSGHRASGRASRRYTRLVEDALAFGAALTARQIAARTGIPLASMGFALSDARASGRLVTRPMDPAAKGQGGAGRMVLLYSLTRQERHDS